MFLSSFAVPGLQRSPGFFRPSCNRSGCRYRSLRHTSCVGGRAAGTGGAFRASCIGNNDGASSCRFNHLILIPEHQFRSGEGIAVLVHPGIAGKHQFAISTFSAGSCIDGLITIAYSIMKAAGQVYPAGGYDLDLFQVALDMRSFQSAIGRGKIAIPLDFPNPVSGLYMTSSPFRVRFSAPSWKSTLPMPRAVLS